MSSLRFTIIIPTRERADTLEAALRTVTSQHYPDLEIIVSDNCSQDNTRAVVEANGDPRIIYINTGKRLSMSHNWEFALGHASGEWIGYIGDDDGLLPDSIASAAAIAQTSGAELIRARSATYLWPVTGERDGKLAVPIGGRSGLRDSATALRRVFAGNDNYLNLPTLYTGGFAHRRVIDRGRAADGSYFQSQIPDVYSAVTLTSLAENFYWSAVPLAINGASRHSTGTAQFSSNADAKRPATLFASEPNIPLHPLVPTQDDGTVPSSIQALLCECYLQARIHHPELLPLDISAQLRAIVRTAGVHRDDIDGWATKFAAANGIAPVTSVEAGARAHQFRELLASVYIDRMDFPRTGDAPIDNVYQASCIANAALQAPTALPVAVMGNLLTRARRRLGF
jgi:hypothetical protein